MDIVEAFPSRFEFYQYQAKKIKELAEREDVAPRAFLVRSRAVSATRRSTETS